MPEGNIGRTASAGRESGAGRRARSVLIEGTYPYFGTERAHARDRGRIPRTYDTGHRYRSKVEILRDFLSAVRESDKKTRIISLANLNPASFQPYLDFCLAHELVEVTSVGYRLTPRADGVLEAIQRLIARTADVDAALLALHRGLNQSSAVQAPQRALRYVSILAWNELVRSASGSLRTKAGPLAGHLTVDQPAITTSAWLDAAVAPELEGLVMGSELLPGAAMFPRRTVVRTGPRE